MDEIDTRLLEELSEDEILDAVELLPEEKRRELLALAEKAQKSQQKAQAQDDFLTFVRQVWPDFICGPHHRIIADKFQEVADGKCNRLMISVPPRMGKLCADSTPVLTTEGWKTHGDLGIGDKVFSPSGDPIRVTAVSPKALADIEVELTNGEVVKCHENHEWTVFDRQKHRTRTVETKELLAYPRMYENGKSRSRWMLPNVDPLNFPEADLPIEPYTLGCWLGDGVSTAPVLTMAEADAAAVGDRIEAFGSPRSKTWVHKETGVHSVSFGGKRGVGSDLQKALRQNNLLGNKHIPESYKVASIDQRKLLISGLIDTDGTVDKMGRVMIATGSKILSDDMYDVLLTLGQRPYVVETQPRLSTSGIQGKKVVYTVCFQPTIDFPVTLERKKLTRFIEQRRIGIQSVRRSNSPELGRCIEVESPDGLYLVTERLVPTHNSELSSRLFPAWMIGRNPKLKIMTATHTAELAQDFGRKVRNLVQEDEYQEIFPGSGVRQDSRAAGRWSVHGGGEYFATGVGGALAGRGADLFIIDDPHDEEGGMSTNPEYFRQIFEWYKTGPRQRLQPGGAIILVMTRWHELDLAGQIIEFTTQNQGGDEWDVINLPMINEDEDGNERALWPEYWPLEECRKLRASLSVKQWSAQYQQQPTSEQSAFWKREWWQEWTEKDPPECDYIIMGIDTAHTKNTTSDYSAIVTFGVFTQENDQGFKEGRLILLDAVNERLEFPALKRRVWELHEYWRPDSLVIEGTAAGKPLIQEFRRHGIPAVDYTPTRGNDKVSRVNACSDILASGLVYAPNTRWAEELIHQSAAFPYGAHDDLVDATVLCLMRFRDGGFIRLPDDYLMDDDDEDSEDFPIAYY